MAQPLHKYAAMARSTILLILIVACGPDPAASDFTSLLDGECAALSLEECNETENGCVVSRGAPYDAEAHCVGQTSDFGCRSGIACGDGNSVLAEDRAGTIWHFPAPCPPTEWQRVSPTNPTYDAASLVPECPTR